MSCFELTSIILKVLHYCGYWPDEKSTIIYKLYGLISYIILIVGYSLATLIGSIKSEDISDAAFLFGSFLAMFTVCVRTVIIYDRRDAIKGFINEIYENHYRYEISGRGIIYRKFENLNRIYRSFLAFCFIGVMACFFGPIFNNNRNIPLHIWFPLDWKHHYLNYVVVYLFTVTSFGTMATISVGQQFIVIFIMFSHAMEIEDLGNHLKNMHRTVGLTNYIKLHGKLKQ